GEIELPVAVDGRHPGAARGVDGAGERAAVAAVHGIRHHAQPRVAALQLREHAGRAVRAAVVAEHDLRGPRPGREHALPLGHHAVRPGDAAQALNVALEGPRSVALRILETVAVVGRRPVLDEGIDAAGQLGALLRLVTLRAAVPDLAVVEVGAVEVPVRPRAP